MYGIAYRSLVRLRLLHRKGANLMKSLISRHFENVSRHLHGTTNSMSGWTGRDRPRLTTGLAQNPDVIERVPAVRILLHEGDVKMPVDEIHILAEVVVEKPLFGNDSGVKRVSADNHDVALLREALVAIVVSLGLVINFQIEFLLNQDHLPEALL